MGNPEFDIKECFIPGTTNKYLRLEVDITKNIDLNLEIKQNIRISCSFEIV
jgi:hypothetical protein